VIFLLILFEEKVPPQILLLKRFDLPRDSEIDSS